VWFVGVYDCDRSYGGPEEGGWWYDVGELIYVEVALSEQLARARQAQLREQYPNTGQRDSVLGNRTGDWDVIVSKGRVPVEHYPERRPPYE
jgi:hypothetical protein